MDSCEDKQYDCGIGATQKKGSARSNVADHQRMFGENSVVINIWGIYLPEPTSKKHVTSTSD